MYLCICLQHNLIISFLFVLLTFFLEEKKEIAHVQSGLFSIHPVFDLRCVPSACNPQIHTWKQNCFQLVDLHLFPGLLDYMRLMLRVLNLSLLMIYDLASKMDGSICFQDLLQIHEPDCRYKTLPSCMLLTSLSSSTKHDSWGENHYFSPRDSFAGWQFVSPLRNISW